MLLISLNHECFGLSTFGKRTGAIAPTPTDTQANKNSRTMHTAFHPAFQNAGKNAGTEIWRVEVTTFCFFSFNFY